MDRPRLRRIANRLPWVGALFWLASDVIHEVVQGHPGGGLWFITALVVSVVLRKVSGLSWREALWPWRRRRVRQLPVSMESVNELARAGERMQAILMHRKLTGASLSASVDAVDAIIGNHPVDTPETRVEPQD